MGVGFTRKLKKRALVDIERACKLAIDRMNKHLLESGNVA
jgi:hypothetical protein